MNELPVPKIGDMATVLVPAHERHIKDLWWWNGAKVVIAGIDKNGRCLIIMDNGARGWFDRRLLVLANQDGEL